MGTASKIACDAINFITVALRMISNFMYSVLFIADILGYYESVLNQYKGVLGIPGLVTTPFQTTHAR